MKLRLLAIAFAAMFLIMAAVASPAQIVYVQNPDFNFAYSSQNDTNGLGNFATSYDNFALGATSNLYRVEWIGSYFEPSAQGPITAWTLNFYADSAGAPGASLYQLNVAGTAGETFLQTDNAGNPAYLYGLNVNFTAVAGTQYWLSVVPDLAFPPEWGWETGTGGDGAAYNCFEGSCSAVPNDLSFALFTPEPGTLVMLGTGILGLAGTLRRKLL